MNKLLVCLFAFIILSCSVGDDTDTTYFEVLPVETATVPDEFVRGETHEIRMTYIRPTTCHAYNDIYYVPEANERSVAIVTTVFSGNGNCVSSGDELEASFEFKATTEDSYVFKFWQGEDENGEDQFLIIEVPVVD